MTTAKFAAGDRVTVHVSRHSPNVRPGTYEIIRPLPISSEGRQYRAKNLLDAHERVFGETELSKA